MDRDRDRDEKVGPLFMQVFSIPLNVCLIFFDVDSPRFFPQSMFLVFILLFSIYEISVFDSLILGLADIQYPCSYYSNFLFLRLGFQCFSFISHQFSSLFNHIQPQFLSSLFLMSFVLSLQFSSFFSHIQSHFVQSFIIYFSLQCSLCIYTLFCSFFFLSFVLSFCIGTTNNSQDHLIHIGKGRFFVVKYSIVEGKEGFSL